MIEEPTGKLAGKVRKIVPYTPPWKAEGTHSLWFDTVGFVDRNGNRGTVKTAYYKNKKDKDQECIVVVKWCNDQGELE